MAHQEPETLSELLAQVEEIYDNLVTTSSVTPSWASTNEQSVARSPPQPVIQIEHRDASKDTSKPIPYTTAFQHRKRDEINRLKVEAQHLNAQLVLLLQMNHDPGKAKVAKVKWQEAQNGRRMWRAKALTECNAVLHSESVNRKLKAALSKQLRVLGAMRKILRQSDILEDMEFVTQAQPMTDQPFFSLDFNDEVSRELSSTITRLYMEADTAVPVVNDTLTVSLHSHYWHRSSCCETSSITHLACPVQEAGDMLWDYYSSAATKIVQDTFRFVPAASNERKWAMTLLVQDKDGTLSSVNGVATYRKYEEANRVVMVGTMMWFLPNEGVQLEDKTWTLITPSTDSSSVIQTSYQLQVKKTGIKQHTHMLETILNYIGEQSRCCLQHQQNLYLDKVLARNTSLCTNEQ